MSAPKMLSVKPLSASICYRPRLCINRNSFYKETYPSWGMAFPASIIQAVMETTIENCQDWTRVFVNFCVDV